MKEEKYIFTSENIPQKIYENMMGKSIPIEYKEKVDITLLSYLTLSFIGFDKKIYQGQMIVNKKIADEVLEIFKKLLKVEYEIEKIKLIDEYEGIDELSMEDNNTSCFCYRKIVDKDKLSYHSLGLAIDINPLYNPCVSIKNVSPQNGKLYVNRNINKHEINKNDNVYNLFKSYGWLWGGELPDKKDYQHFYKIL